MNFLRKHWFDIGGIFAAFVLIYVLLQKQYLSDYQTLMWISLLTLFLHQLEEYRITGTFPGMINSVLYKSNLPDRYPLNTNTSFYINVALGWTCYLLAALLAEKAIWLGIATILVSVGNIFVHTIVFNIKGRTLYNAGMTTSLLLFLPVSYFFFYHVFTNNLATVADYLIGFPLGIFISFFGILKLIQWMKNRNTPFIFEQRNLLTQDRK